VQEVCAAAGASVVLNAGRGWIAWWAIVESEVCSCGRGCAWDTASCGVEVRGGGEVSECAERVAVDLAWGQCVCMRSCAEFGPRCGSVVEARMCARRVAPFGCCAACLKYARC
jgi:hypothetical protein